LGDGIVAFFGYPLAHEGEAERAIHAGLAIVDALAKLEVPEVGRIQVRIGIATGVVVVSSAEKGAVGETMNLASRLQGMAPVGAIVVSERVRRLAGGAFDYDDLGEQTLKGIARATRAYRITGVSQASSRFEAATQEGLTPMVGRELEIAMLLERWSQAQDGEGQVVLLSGEPGIGKSRILSALRERLESQAASTLRFQCSPYHLNSAFYPIIGNFERALKFTRDETADSKLDKLEALVVTHYSRPLSDVRFIASLLSLPVESRYGATTMTPQKFKDETLRSLVDLTEAAARGHPTVMLYEDAHWADPTSLESLDQLIDRMRSIPLLLVITHRPEFQPKWTAHAHVVALNLSKLTRSQSGALISKLAHGKALPGDLLERILTKTDGVPLFVEELTKSILESGDLKDAGDRYEYTGDAGSITIPASLRDSLMARLDRHAAAKEIAQIGAAIGREFGYELIAAVAPMSKPAIDDGLQRLTDSGLAFRRGNPPDAVYTFKHALVQDVAYDSLLKSRRQELHAKIASAIGECCPEKKDNEPELLAYHLSAAGRSDLAIPLWQKAGELALKRMALTEAISHLNHGVELISTLPSSSQRDASELRLRIVLGTAWMAFKGWPAQEVWSALHPALALAKSLKRDDALLPVLWGLWCHIHTQGRRADALDWAKEMLDIGESSGDSDILMLGHIAAMCSYFHSGELLIKAREHGDQGLVLYDPERHYRLADILNLDPKTFVGVWTAHLTWMLGYPDQALKVNDAKDEHARRRGHVFDVAFALTLGADLFDYRCEAEALRKRAEEAERLGRENSLPLIWGCLAPLRYGMALVRQNKFAEGAATLKTGLALWEGGGGRVTSPHYKYALAEAMAHLGDLDGAIGLIDEVVVTQVTRPGWEERSHYAEILRLKGWMLSLKGDLAGAEQSYLASLDWARQQQAKSWELRTSTSLARLWQAQGKHREALHLLKPVYDWFTEGFDTKDLKEAKALLTELGEYTD
ncbi:MAG: AAA family ATPase, partial [Burkholderiales bacterium]